MGWWRLSARRARRQASLLVTIAAVSALVTALFGIVLTSGEVALRNGARHMLTETTPDAGAVRLGTAYDRDDPDGQTAEVDEILSAALRDASVTVERTVTSAPVPVADGGHAVLTSFAPDSEMRLLSGAWPDETGQTTVSVHAAERLGVDEGDRIVAGSAGTLEVVGIWEPVDPRSPRWNADPLTFRGESSAGVGPLVVDERVLGALASADVTWTIRPDRDSFSVGTVPDIRIALDRLGGAVPDIGDGSDAVTLDGALDATFERIVRADATARALASVPLTLLAVVGILVLALLGRELSAARAADTVLLRSRGASVRALTVVAAVEGLLITTVGAAVGVLGSSVLGSSVLEASPTVDTTVGVAVATIAGATLTLLVAGRPRWDTAREPSGRAGVLADVAILLPAAAVTVLALLQLRSGGLLNGEAAVVDPLAASAPALLVVALLLVARTLMGPALSGVAALAARGRGLLPVYPLRQLARRARSVSAGLLVVALGAAGILFAATVQRTLADSDARAAAVTVVTDARVRFSPRDLPDDLDRIAETIAEADGVHDVLPALVSEGDLGGSPVGVVAADVARLARLEPVLRLPSAMGDASDALDAVITVELARRAGLRVGDAARLTMRGVPPELPIEVAAIVADIPAVADPAVADPDGVLVDRAELDEIVDATGAAPPVDDELWVRGGGPLEATLSTLVPIRADVVTTSAVSDAPVLGAVIGLSWGTATATAAVGLVGFAAVLAALARARAPEVLPLRVAGARPRLQARSRFVETVGLAAFGGIVGAGCGVAAAASTIPLAISSIATVAPAVEWPPVLIAALVGGALAVLIGAAAARAVGRLAAAPSRREGLS